MHPNENKEAAFAASPPRRLWHGYALAAASGVLLVFSWPNALLPAFSVWPGYVAFVALIPYLLAWRSCGWRGAAVYAWIMGFIYFMGILTWINLLNKDTNVDNALGWIFFSVCGGVYFALFGASARWVVSRLRWPGLLVLPISWAAWEYVRGHFLAGGWPWGSLGHTQYANPLVRQFAAVAGVSGVSALIVFINAALLILGGRVLRRPEWLETLWTEWSGMRKRPLLMGTAVVMTLAAVLLAGVVVKEAWQYHALPKTRIQLALIQPNMDTNQKWDQQYRTQLMQRMRDLHQQAVQLKPDLVVWAESSFPAVLELPRDQEWAKQLREIIRSGGIPTALTSNEYETEYEMESEQGYHHYNSAFVLDAQGEILGRYRKIHLVPFGEYIPYEVLRKFFRTIVEEPIPVDFEPGEEYTVFHVGPHPFSIMICYEDIFENVGCGLARQSPGFFVSLSNNGWAKTTDMIYQHTAMAVFLAVENRLPMAKADVTGPTCVIDAWGKISTPLPYMQAGVLAATVEWAQFKTFFTRCGEGVPRALLAVYVLFCALAAIRPNRGWGRAHTTEKSS